MKSINSITTTTAQSLWGRALFHVGRLCRDGVRPAHGRFAQVVVRLPVFNLDPFPALMVLLLNAALSMAAAPAGAGFDLRSSVQVDSSGIFLQQLVSTSPTAPQLQPIRLGDAPAFGRAAFLTTDQIGELLRLRRF